ncbi:F0F1 ATP synthase subunit A [Desulfobaculum bizertense]|uniref:ATP synthase subunit a n=1 Tax=Desulfobaculum bizertense DSM 18034 TaxID=1121442 RepID=A0A1T4WC69_9BACT|nr:F0F1 ATP synthase subunit A [Desulfobaculum bizertense]SKA74902.1 ATP synthase F0 subcomplex A subunit [Desulfobaculum bizertense DSM 18034]
MDISPDWIVYYQYGPFVINKTIVLTWLVMGILVCGSWLVTRRLVRPQDLTPEELASGKRIPRGQTVLESIVVESAKQIDDVMQVSARGLLPFLGTLFLYILVSNLLGAVPGFDSPTGSLSTTVALSLCVFIMVPAYGIFRGGIRTYLKVYVQPSPFMLPLNIFSELSRTMALAVRLFGNIMSGRVMGMILLIIAPLFVPVVMQLLGLLIGVVQAYIFAVLAAVYIAAGIETDQQHMNE